MKFRRNFGEISWEKYFFLLDFAVAEQPTKLYFAAEQTCKRKIWENLEHKNQNFPNFGWKNLRIFNDLFFGYFHTYQLIFFTKMLIFLISFSGRKILPLFWFFSCHKNSICQHPKVPLDRIFYFDYIKNTLDPLILAPYEKMKI